FLRPRRVVEPGMEPNAPAEAARPLGRVAWARCRPEQTRPRLRQTVGAPATGRKARGVAGTGDEPWCGDRQLREPNVPAGSAAQYEPECQAPGWGLGCGGRRSRSMPCTADEVAARDHWGWRDVPARPTARDATEPSAPTD